jgi:transposase
MNENNRLIRENQDLQSENESLRKALRSALAELENFRELFTLNSQNSSKPPSTDQKKNNSTSSKKKGPPFGHKGYYRKLYSPEQIDTTVTSVLESCPHCGFEEIIPRRMNPVIHQQVEVCGGKTIITQYERLRYICPQCSRHLLGALPEGISPSAFGPKLSSIVGMLTGKYHLSKRECQRLLNDLFLIDISLGGIIEIEKRISYALKPIWGNIRNSVLEGKDPTHADETSWRNSGITSYVWIACTKESACFSILPRRNKEMGKTFLGNLNKPFITDRFSLYRSFDGPHQYCLAHILRDFKRMSERKGLDGIIGKALQENVKKVFLHWQSYKEGKIHFQQLQTRCYYRRTQLRLLLEEGSLWGHEKLRGLCTNILSYFDRMWTFLRIPGMEPTNNMAERDLRSIVLWRKKSFGTRSSAGDRFVERIMSLVKTAEKRCQNVLDWLHKVFVQAIQKNLPTGEEC